MAYGKVLSLQISNELSNLVIGVKVNLLFLIKSKLILIKFWNTSSHVKNTLFLAHTLTSLRTPTTSGTHMGPSKGK